MRTINYFKTKNTAKFNYIFALCGILMIGLSACQTKQQALAKEKFQDRLENGRVKKQMGKRYYMLELETLSQSVSNSLSTKNKIAANFQKILGPITNVETGYQVWPGKGQVNICKFQPEATKSFTNIYKFTGSKYTLWVSARVEEKERQGNMVQLLFTTSETMDINKSVIVLPPEMTENIFLKLWETIEEEFN